MRDRLDAGAALDLDREHERAGRGARSRVVVDVDPARVAGALDRPSDFDHPVVAPSERRIDLNGQNPLVLMKRAREIGLRALLGNCDQHLALGEDEGGAGLTLLLDRRGDGCDLGRGCSAAAADHARSEVARVGGELCEVLRGGVRVDDPVPGHAGEADVRHRGERETVAAHLAQRGQRRLDSGAVVGADRRDPELMQALGRLLGREPGKRLRAGVEREHREDRQRRDAADGLDRGLELLEIEERLDGEQVDATSLEHRRLLREDLDLRSSARRRAHRAARSSRR